MVKTFRTQQLLHPVELFHDSLRLLFFILCFAVLPQLSEAREDKAPLTFELPSASWAELTYTGSKFLTSLTTKVQLKSAEKTDGHLLDGVQPGVMSCVGKVHADKQLTVHFLSESIGFSLGQYEEHIWFDGATARPAKRLRQSSGSAPWIKNYCFETNGVRREKILPGGSSENKLSPANWTKRTVSYYEYPKEAASCAVISDPVLLLYILSTLETAWQQKPFDLCVFGKKQLHRLTIRGEEATALQLSYTTAADSEQMAVDEQIIPLVFSIHSAALSPDQGQGEAFSLLGLHRDIRIYMDPEKRLPVKISGTNNSMGKLVLDLKAVER